jgi:Divergent InlB B-repeat domain
VPRFLLLAALVATLGVLALPGSAGAFVYWANHDSIGRANLDGSGVDQSFIPLRGANLCSVGVDGGHVYWGSGDYTGFIGRANLGGTGVNRSFISLGLFHVPCGVAVDSAHLYWPDTAGSSVPSIGRASLNGTGVDPSFITGAGSACGFAVDGGHVYWGRAPELGASIARANLNGTGVDESFIPVHDNFFDRPCGVAVDGGHVYWARSNNVLEGVDSIGRANLNGSGVEQNFITGASDPCGVAVDGGHIYWANTGTDTIGRANLDGSGVNQNFITVAPFASCGVAVDGLPRRNLTVAMAGPGSGTVSGPGINCGVDCAEAYADGSQVTLTAGPAAGSTFAGWGGACSATGPCTVAMDSDKSVTATFTAHRTLSVSTTGQGSGHITGPGVKCGVDCSEVYADGTQVSLNAKPGEHSKFAGWSGGCAGTGSCELTIDADKSVSARFKFKAPGTKVTKVKVRARKRRARFAFEKAGKANRFECQLKRKHHQAKGFAKCASPKTYKDLKPGQYKFRVRAVGPGGHDPKPPDRLFRIRPY